MFRHTTSTVSYRGLMICFIRTSGSKFIPRTPAGLPSPLIPIWLYDNLSRKENVTRSYMQNELALATLYLKCCLGVAME